MARKRGPKSMSDEHKAALAEGRTQGRAVRVYLDALESNKPKRGRKRTPASIANRIKRIESDMKSADALRRLQLVQERIDLERELATAGASVDLGALEQAFIDAAQPYSQRKGISYAAWRELGVTPSVLRKAGISRSG